MNKKPQCAKDLREYVGRERREVRNPCITAREAIFIANYIDQLESVMGDLLGAVQGYQKAGGADRSVWDFSDEIRRIEEFINE